MKVFLTMCGTGFGRNMFIFEEFDITKPDQLADYLKQYPGGTALTIGKLDGIHRGHKKLLQACQSFSLKNACNITKTDIACGAITFGKAPYAVVSKEIKPALSTKEERRVLIADQGMDFLLELPFTEAIRTMEAEEFVQQILVKLLHVKFLAVGTDFCFGKNRSGNAALLLALAPKYGFEVSVIEKEQVDGIDIGSTRISNLIMEGKIEKANELLGYPYMIDGVVVDGAKLGRTMGFPTLNQLPNAEKLLPPNGVYRSKTAVLRADGSVEAYYESVTNIGTKPTVNDTISKTVETNLFDFSGDCYGRMVRVFLYHFQRAERPFPSIEALKEQIHHDVLTAKKDWKIDL